jgi:hypothetical protein
MSDTTVLPISSIRADGGTQPRARASLETVSEYAEAMSSGASFPPLVVFFDGTTYWLADGFHRRDAALMAGLEEIAVFVRQGTLRDAILYSVGANSSHGLRRTNDDKRRSVRLLLEDEEWGKWSDAEIARRCKVSDKTVAGLRPVTSEIRSERTYTTKHGTTAKMETAKIGKSERPLNGTTRHPEALDNSEESYKKRLAFYRKEAECGSKIIRKAYLSISFALDHFDPKEREAKIDSIITWLESKRVKA